MTVTPGSDAELLGRVRTGDDDALGELYVRHRAAALRLARSYGAGADTEDVVSAAFERVIAALRRGSGPVGAFRPYLFVTVRRLCGARGAAHDSLDELPEGVAAVEASTIDLSDRALVAEAFADLPDRWQAVLWHTAVEGRRPREVAQAVGVPANTVAVLAHRARERLRQRYLQAHLRADCPAACAPHRARLGAFVRGGLTRRARAAVDAHLVECDPCRRLAAELDDVNRLLARAIAPVFLLAGEALPPAATGPVGGGAVAVSDMSAAADAGGASTGLAGGGASLTGGGAAVGGGALGVTGGALGVGTIAKVAAVVAAVVGLGAVAPVDFGAGSEPPDVEVAVPSAGDAGPRAEDRSDPSSSTASVPGAATSVPSASTAAPSTTAAGRATTVPGLELEVEAGQALDLEVEAGPGVGVDASLTPLPDVAVDAQVGVLRPGEGVTLDAAWRAGVLGTGTLAVGVANAAAETLADARLVVDLSPGARPSSLGGTACRASDPGLIGAVLSLIGSLTCGLAALTTGADATVDLPLTVLGNGQVATVRLIAGGVEIASTTVDLVR